MKTKLVEKIDGSVEEVKVKTEETAMQQEKPKIGKIKIKCNAPSGWVMDDPVQGKRAVRPGETVELDPNNGMQLHTIIQVLRQVNNPRINETEYKVRGTNMHEKVRRFEIVGGLEGLPEVLQKTKMSQYEYTNEERAAINSLVSEFPPFTRKERHTISFIR